MCDPYSKIIFLDIDGVLNMMGVSYYSMGYDVLGNDPIEPHLMRRLEFVLERLPDVNIVISSAWHQSQVIRRLTQMRFKYIDRIVGRTLRDERYRGEQIFDYIDKRKLVTDFVVLDDEVSDICGIKSSKISPSRVIEVNSAEGLSNVDAIAVVHKFNKISDTPVTIENNDSDVFKEEYQKWYNLGFRPQVNVSDLNEYKSFKTLPYILTLHMEKKDVVDT